MKLEVGMYVRSNDFGIKKITWFDHGEPIMNNGWTALQDNARYSRNIIDLIEVGDVVLLGDGKNTGFVVATNDKYGISLNGIGFTKEVKEILTKEQYESNVYKIGGLE